MSSGAAFSIFPVGQYASVPPQQRYRAALRIIDKFKFAGLRPGEYSILLYDTDRFKIEVRAESVQIDATLRPILDREAFELAIVTWRSEPPDDSEEDLHLKLVATSFREGLPQRDPFQCSLKDLAGRLSNITKESARDAEKQDRFVHLVLNPLGDADEGEIRRLMAGR